MRRPAELRSAIRAGERLTASREEFETLDEDAAFALLRARLVSLLALGHDHDAALALAVRADEPVWPAQLSLN
jgi:hypothetical protein